MLYDPKWEIQTKPDEDVFSNATFIAWIKTKPPAETYCYLDHGRCLISQYLAANGYECVEVYSNAVFTAGAEKIERPYPPAWNDIAVDEPRTFGAAFKRARRRLA